jgi:hypothetical protein
VARQKHVVIHVKRHVMPRIHVERTSLVHTS